MKITQTFEPVRPINAPDDGSVYASMVPSVGMRVHYGQYHWPSCSYWIVPRSHPLYSTWDLT